MKSFKPLGWARLCRKFAELGYILAALAIALQAQPAGGAAEKPEPATIAKQVILFPDSVLQEQWAHTLKLVNPPQNLELVNPGQCIRIGIVANGDGRDGYLERSQLSFRVEFVGQTRIHAPLPLAQIKQIKPKGGDLVTSALGAAGIKNPVLTMQGMGASAEKWCVPEDARDGTATIDAEVDAPDGHQKEERATIQVESFEAGSKRTFKDENEIEDFLMNYYRQPNPARLLPLVQFFAEDTKMRSQTGVLETTSTSVSAALKADPVAAKDFMNRVSAQSGFTRALGLLALLNSGYNIGPVLKTLSEEDRQKFSTHPVLPDPFDLSHVEDIGTRLDMLWATFTVTGQIAPIEKIATALAWRNDWEDFDKARKSSNPPKEWTPAIGRALGYGAAGWAMGSFQRTNPLAADYIEFMIASPETAAGEKSELEGLETNPAFK